MSDTRPVRSTVAAAAVVTADVATIGALREAAAPPGAPAAPPRFLRHADEHTVVAFRAVQEALAGVPALAAARRHHGVVAAPCGAGRPWSARTLVQLREAGPVTVSPHVVPHCSLHSVAAAVSIGLGMHGPSIGVGGGPEALAEGCLAALLLLAEREVDACWLVATAWDTEPVLDGEGGLPPDAVCRAVALALDPAAAGSTRLLLRGAAAPAIVPGPRVEAGGGASLAHFAAALDVRRPDTAPPDGGCDGCLWSVHLPWGGVLSLDHDVHAARGRRAA